MSVLYTEITMLINKLNSFSWRLPKMKCTRNSMKNKNSSSKQTQNGQFSIHLNLYTILFISLFRTFSHAFRSFVYVFCFVIFFFFFFAITNNAKKNLLHVYQFVNKRKRNYEFSIRVLSIICQS